MSVTSKPIVSTAWMDDAIDLLAFAPWGYHAGESSAAEPTALAALALLGAGRIADAQAPLQWLASAQTSDGSIAPFSELTQSAWPTPQAIFATATASRLKIETRFNLSQATQWLLTAEGKTIENSPDFGHNGQLVGWPWVIGTHSWQEPTAWSVLSLKALGKTQHPRAREGVRLLVDRLLSTGGCNYGNTVVLGQQLRPQVEPTGIALLALADEKIDDPRIELSLQYLLDNLSADTTPISLGYGLLGLTAHHRRPRTSAAWLKAAYLRTVERDVSPFALALLVLAGQATECPLIKYTAAESAA